ncbi:MAG TPA: S8 family peptidase [Acidimicrobiales bacterium]|nr:S8 family peptidase [Acidimicrobiales bacterium]
MATVLGAVISVAGTAGADPQDKHDYIVVFKDSVNDPGAAAADQAKGGQADVHFVYTSALKGYAATMTEARAAAIARDPRVDSVVADTPVTADSTQTAATWGLDRVDQRALPLSTTFNYTASGAGVTAYVIDTGINVAHSEFGTRASHGTDKIDGSLPAADCNGHGTHVAGTIGGATYGVAKSVKLVAVRVLDCQGSGSTSGVIAGVDWVTANAVKPAVANMSLGGGTNSALDTAVSNSIASGITYGLAAGNGNIIGIAQDACTTSPARVASGITVGASDKTDKKASFSNYGNCVDLFAPGVSIVSAWYSSNTATNTISGTSMATPHVVGAAALYLSTAPTATPAAVRTYLYDATTKGIVTAAKTSNNHLLFTNNL